MLARESKSAAGNKRSRTADFVRMWRRPQDGEGASVSKNSQRLPGSQGRLGLLAMYSIEPQLAARHSPFRCSCSGGPASSGGAAVDGVTLRLEGGEELLAVARPAGIEGELDLGVADRTLQESPLVVDLEHVRLLGGDGGENAGERAGPIRDPQPQDHAAPFPHQAALEGAGAQVHVH